MRCIAGLAGLDLCDTLLDHSTVSVRSWSMHEDVDEDGSEVKEKK